MENSNGQYANWVAPLEIAAQETMKKERSAASFDVRKMINFLEGGEEHTYYKELATQMIERDPELRVNNFFDITRSEARAKCMQQVRRYNEIKRNLISRGETLLSKYFDARIDEYDRSLGMKLYVHEVLFRETIWAQGTSEQWNAWSDDIAKMRVLGCYSMTELGHSSHLQGLETTATFDEKHQEFIIHTPTITATKWWIGMAGQSATHTVVLAKLIVHGKDHGLNWFIVPIRCPNSGRLFPGVTAGDVGAKMGRNGLDNGYLQFTHVRVPRTNMLMKWTQVSPQGEVSPAPNATLVYASLVGERLMVLPGLYAMVSQAATIAVRYGIARRQGSSDQQIMDFQGFQYPLIPVVASLYAANISYKVLSSTWENTLKLSEKPETQPQFLEGTHDMHSMTAGLKAWYGWWGTEALEICRRSLGGHGYSSYNAIAGIIGDYGVFTTGGGDNIVLAQQSARYLLSAFKKMMNGKPLKGSVAYLQDCPQTIDSLKLPQDFLSSEKQLSLLRVASFHSLQTVAEKLISSGKSMEEAWNENMVVVIQTSRVYAFYHLLANFVRVVKSVDREDLRQILSKLCNLFALSSIENMLPLFLEHKLLNSDHIPLLRSLNISLCKDIRKDILSLVDAFNIPDWILKAPVGRYDGAIYSNYLDIVQRAPEAIGVPSYFEKSIAPLTTQSKL